MNECMCVSVEHEVKLRWEELERPRLLHGASERACSDSAAFFKLKGKKI